MMIVSLFFARPVLYELSDKDAEPLLSIMGTLGRQVVFISRLN